VIVHVESCQKLLHENFYELISFSIKEFVGEVGFGVMLPMNFKSK